jgi:uncharacterized membrane protein
MLNTVKHVLQGKGYLSHPLHVVLVHLPLGLWEGGYIFDLMSRRRGWQKLSEVGYYTNLAAIGAAVPTAVTGVAEWLDIPTDHPAWPIATAHATLNDIVLGMAAYNWWSRRNRSSHAPANMNLVLGGAAVALLGLSAWLGGLLIYNYGYGVHRQGSAVEKQHQSLAGEQPREEEPIVVPEGDPLQQIVSET